MSLPFLLVHGTALGAITFRGLSRRLIAAGFTVQAVDRIGYDGAPVPAYSLDGEVAHLVGAARAAFGDRPFHVVGHSLGGLFALHLARTLREGPGLRVDAVTLLDPVAARLLRESDEGPGWEDMDETYRAFFGAEDDEAAIAGFVTRWSGPSAWGLMAPGARAAAISLVPRVRLEFAETRTRDRPTDDLLAFDAPVHVIVGGATREAPRGVARALARRRGATVETIPGAGHLLPISHPEEVAASLRTRAW